MAAYRVLVVEDNHEVRRMVTASIKTLGAEIDVLDVPSAEEALFISASLPLDLVILDIRLPGMSGLEMVGRLRKRKPETKIILVTGVEDAEIRKQVSKAGAEAFFFKPIEIAKFLEAVKHSLWSEQNEVPPSSEVKTRPVATLLTGSSVKELPGERLRTPSDRQTSQAPTLKERLLSLKNQLKAACVLLMEHSGQILEEAGNRPPIITDSSLFPVLLQAFHASLQVSQAMTNGTCASLQYYALKMQCLYMAPIGQKHALLIATVGYFEPDKLGKIDQAIHQASYELQAILADMVMEEEARQDVLKDSAIELPAEVTVDPETLAKVEDMFLQATLRSNAEQADGFWEALGESETQEGVQGKDVLSYDQARDLGLTPKADQQARALKENLPAGRKYPKI